jgi:hypothetical protein
MTEPLYEFLDRFPVHPDYRRTFNNTRMPENCLEVTD